MRMSGEGMMTKRDKLRSEQEAEEQRVQRAKELLAERLKETDLFREKGKTTSEAREKELAALKLQVDAQIKADVEKAKREAEEERELRKAEAVIAHKLFEKEQKAKASVVEARKQARAERRLEKQEQSFLETKAELDEAERARKKRQEDREKIAKSIAAAAPTVVPAADKDKLREQYVREAALRADAMEAAKAAEAAMKRAVVATAKEDQQQKKSSSSVELSSLSINDRKLRRSVLETLDALAKNERCTVEAIKSAAAKAAAVGLGDDCPELLEARRREHELAVARAREIIAKHAGEHVFAKEQYETLVNQGYNRAAERGRRKMEDLWQKKTEAEGTLQYHEAQLAVATQNVDNERERRVAAGIPTSTLVEDAGRGVAEEDYHEAPAHKQDEAAKQQRREARAKEKARAEAAQKVAAAQVSASARAEAFRAKSDADIKAKRDEEMRILAAKEAATLREKELAARDKQRRVDEAAACAARADAARASAVAAKAAARLDSLRLERATRLATQGKTHERRALGREYLERQARCRRQAARAARDLLEDLQARRDALIDERKKGLARDTLASLVLGVLEDPGDDALSVSSSATSDNEEEQTTSSSSSGDTPTTKVSDDDDARREEAADEAPEEKQEEATVRLHFHHPDDATLNLSFEFHIPDRWRAKPTRRLLDVFAKKYVARKGPHVHAADLRLATLAGAPLELDSPVASIGGQALRVVSCAAE